MERDETHELLAPMDRREFLRWTAMMGGSALVALGGPGAEALAAGPNPKAKHEPGTIQVFDWAGYDDKHLWTLYAREYPKTPPHFTFLTSDIEALDKIKAGYRPTLAHPCFGYIREYVQTGLLQPFNTKLIPNFRQLNPALERTGVVNGKQYGIALDWGFGSILYRTDKVHPKANSWELAYDERYAGKISWWDDQINLVIDGYVQGLPDPWNQSDAELETTKQRLIQRKKVVRNFWTSDTDMENDFAAGNIWIASYAWPNDWLAMHQKKLPVAYMKPREGRLAWVCGFVLLAGTPDYYHAHDYVNAWASVQTGLYLYNNWAYGHANMKVPLNKVSPELIKLFDLKHPSVLQEPHSHVLRYQPRLTEYTRAWEEVKAA